jgi:hypothetical protein
MFQKSQHRSQVIQCQASSGESGCRQGHVFGGRRRHFSRFHFFEFNFFEFDFFEFDFFEFDFFKFNFFELDFSRFYFLEFYILHIFYGNNAVRLLAHFTETLTLKKI